MSHPADHAGPFVLVDDLAAPVLRADDAHHLQRVLRVRTGDPIVLGDGAGSWRPARFGSPLEPAGDVERAERPTPEVTVAFALVKGERPELIVQKLTELGVDRVVPFRAERSVVRWDDAKAVRSAERLRAVARGAAVQCHRPWLPIVEEVASLDELLARPGAALADRDGGAPDLSHPLVLVGPEGGWADAEREAARARSAGTVALGDHVLRVETAAIAAGVLLTSLRAGRTT